MTHVKICGIKTLNDALAAIDAGADMIGFNFYLKSARFVAPSRCADIQAALANRGAPVVTVGVFVNAAADEVTDVMDLCGLDLAQLHGDEPPEMLEALDGRAFKAIRPKTAGEARDALARYPHRAEPPALLVDAFSRAGYGGTGETGDWHLAAELAAEHAILLAGGLCPENVQGALAQVRPWGVDVASGVEAARGVKDPARMAAFVRAVRSFEPIQE
jgi:phosphoribosylanthranilate isomerase